MRIGLALLAAASLVSGCDSKIETAVRAKLKDPDSAKFQKEVKIGDRACIAVNSKNSYGGFTGFTVATLIKIGPEWLVESIEDGTCDEKTVQTTVDRELEAKKIMPMILQLMKDQKLAPAESASITSIPDLKCRHQALLAYGAGRNSIIDPDGQKHLGAGVMYKQYLAEIKAGSCASGDATSAAVN